MRGRLRQVLRDLAVEVEVTDRIQHFLGTILDKASRKFVVKPTYWINLCTRL
jgi:hypothetical protein